jgi:hypothetical protein
MQVLQLEGTSTGGSRGTARRNHGAGNINEPTG